MMQQQPTSDSRELVGIIITYDPGDWSNSVITNSAITIAHKAR
jgi:hypothetical protein